MASEPTLDNLPVISFENQKDWETWLKKHHNSSPGVWLQIAKKASGIQSVTIEEALDSALCYGWIDGQRKRCDDTSYLQKYTPRRPKSVWSKINREKALQLIKDRRMKPAGLRAIESAKADGRWDAAYDSPGRAEVPPDFQEALNNSPKAKAFFDSLDRTNKYLVGYKIQTARKAETRAKRIEQFIRMLENNEKPRR